jgi:hypothetical protein
MMAEPRVSTKVDLQEIRRAASLLLEAGHVYEIRAFGKGTTSGYFSDCEKLALAAANLSGKVPAVYFTLNPVLPDLLARSVNRVNQYVKQTTNDTQIVKRRWLPVDFDAEYAHKLGISSTDAEHQAALERAQECREWLRSRGWPEPIYADSGNGAHLLYPVYLPNDQDSTTAMMDALKALAFKFDDDRVNVDTGNFNAARIWKLFGTLVCKGDSTPDRPHRLARILEVPA